MSDQIDSFCVRDLLKDENRYIVPMYQRNYAWGEGEINQLIQDVLDMQQKHKGKAAVPPYYIGTLVVYQRADGIFEVIDGQQRFTTMTLIALCLKRMAQAQSESKRKLQLPSDMMDWYEAPNLEFENRPKSVLTLNSLNQGVPLDKLRDDHYNLDVVNGFALLEKGLTDLKDKLGEFCDYLFKSVLITRVPVPKDTDLNHYFEAMNNRGEQLEKHEVLKARMMSVLNDSSELKRSQHTLAKVWDAAANMERYIQYGFTPNERHKIFGKDDWGKFIPQNFDELAEFLSEPNTDKKAELGTSKSLKAILATAANIDPSGGGANGQLLQTERFSSVINFSNFLLHVLRIFANSSLGDNKSADVPLDDKQLLEQFEKHIFNSDQAIEKSKLFIFTLLKTKYLFDQFIIKREFADGQDKWSLKRLRYYSKESQSYVNSFDKDSEDGYEGKNRHILMLLSALHVSTPTMVYKHWLNGALKVLYEMREVKDGEYLTELEQLTRKFVYGRFLCEGEGATYFDLIYKGTGYSALNFNQSNVIERVSYGGIENNLVFNYLDYLIWRKGVEIGTSDDVVKQFEFTFRSSVEHFYPQHPMDGHIELDQCSLHSFGNLCLISHSKNSRLSNYQPVAKRDHFKAAIADKKIDTLKLYEMIKLMGKFDTWGKEQIQLHQKQMLTILEIDSRQSEGIELHMQPDF